MKNKFSKVFFVIVALLAVCLLAVACNPDEQNPPDPVKYTVTYVGGTGTTGTAPTGGEYAESAKFNLPDAGTLAKPDHTFGGWSYGGTTYATGAEFTMPKNDVEFTAVWNPASATTYIVTFGPDGYAQGTNPDAKVVNAGEGIVLPANPYTVKDDYVGYVFKGWYVSEDGRNSTLYQPGDNYIPTATVKMVAKFVSANTINVTYKAGENATGKDFVKEYDKNQNFYPISASTAGFTATSGYNFQGWKLQGDSTNKIYTTTEECSFATDVTFIAQWDRSNQFVQYDTKNTATFVMILSDDNTGSGFIEIYSDIIGASSTKVNFTYTLNGTALSITLVNSDTFNGTFDGEVVTMTVTYNSKQYVFKKAEIPTGAPSVTFDANGGTGTAPTISMESTPNGYKFIIPQNTFTAPANKEFKSWLVIVNGDRNGAFNRNPGSSFFAQTGESIVFEAVWKNSSVVELTGTTYEGNCTVPTQKGPGDIQLGGKTYTQFVVNFETNQVAYLISTETQKVVVAATPVTSDIPTVYANATCYEVRLYDNLAYYLIFNADKTKMTIRESVHTDKAIANEEFLKQGTVVEETKYDVTYSLGDIPGAVPAASKVAEGGAFELPAVTNLLVNVDESTTKMFVGWSDGVNNYTAGATYNMPAKNVTFTAQWVDGSQFIGGYASEYAAFVYLNNGSLKAGVIGITETESYTYCTYTLNGEDITIKVGGNTVAVGKYDQTYGLTTVLTLNGQKYVFGPVKPTLNFNANGGTGEGPDVNSIVMTYNADYGTFSITLPANTYTAPANQEFKAWQIGMSEYQPGDKRNNVNAGATLAIKAVWQDTTPAITGLEFNGEITISIGSKSTTITKIVVDFDTLKMNYYTVGKDEPTEINIVKQSYLPDGVATDSLYYSTYFGNKDCYILIDKDKSILTIYDGNDNLLTSTTQFVSSNYTGGGEDPTPEHPDTVTVTFDLNGGTSDTTLNPVEIAYGATVSEPVATLTHPGGKFFRYWREDGKSVEYDFSAPITKNITLVAYYEYRATFSVGEGTGTVEPIYGNSIVLPDGTGLSNGSKQFDGWTDGLDSDNDGQQDTYQAGERVYLTGNKEFTAIWKEAVVITSGTYVGSYNGCTQIIVNFSNNKVQSVVDGTNNSSWGTDLSTDANKPKVDGYGDNTKYISFKCGTIGNVYALVSSDRTKLKLCSGSHEVLAEFTLQA